MRPIVSRAFASRDSHSSSFFAVDSTDLGVGLSPLTFLHRLSLIRANFMFLDQSDHVDGPVSFANVHPNGLSASSPILWQIVVVGMVQ